jgi:hypothetical protein
MRLNAHLRTKLERGSLGQWRTQTSTLQRTDGTAVAASTVGIGGSKNRWKGMLNYVLNRLNMATQCELTEPLWRGCVNYMNL